MTVTATGETLEPPKARRHVPWGAVSGIVVLVYVVVWGATLTRISDRNTFNRWGAGLGSLGARVVVCGLVLAALFHSFDGVRRLLAEAMPSTVQHDARLRAAVLFATWAIALPCFAIVIWPWVAETTR
jgi:succinate dehydrogenase/fumarate reductase cytochrome b subunit